MVADKAISTLSGSVCGDADDEVTLGEAPTASGKSMDGLSQAKVLEPDSTPEGSPPESPNNNESSLDNFCEVVVSFRCKFCPFVAVDREAIKSHVSDVHSESQNPSETGDLPKQDSETVPLEQQPSPVEPEKPAEKDEVFFCSDCSIIFSSAELCCTHMIQVHNLQIFATELIRENPLSSQKAPTEPKRKRIRCSKQSLEKSPAKKSKQCSNVEHMCKLCKTKFSSTATLQIHEKCHIATLEGCQTKKSKSSKSYVKGYLCCCCEPDKTGKFLTWGKCAFHLWKEHEIDCDLYSCSVCKYKTPTLAKLKDHERLHSSEAKFTCSTCRKSFKQFKQLKTHEKYHKTNQTKLSPPSEARWYTPKECPVCNRILSDSKCLKKHISAVHNKMKPYACNICGHTSARKAELQLHVRQHTGEKPYKCPACPFSTGDHNSLRKHKQRHADTKPYECPHCDYSAIQSHAFKKHVLAVHPGQEVVFVCPSCHIVSVNEKSFEAHRKDHEEGRIPADSLNEQPSPVPSTNQAVVNVSVDECTMASTESTASSEGKPRTKFWLRDEDSMEVVDTGGITIPASETEKINDSTQHVDTRHNSPPDIELLSGGDDPGTSSTSSSSCTPTFIPVDDNTTAFGIGDDPPIMSSMLPCSRDSTSSSAEGGDVVVVLQSSNFSAAEIHDKDKGVVNNSDSKEGDDAASSNNNKNQNGEQSVVGKSFPELSAANGAFGPIDESRAISIVTELLAEGDCNTLNQFFLEPLLNDSIDLPDILYNEHSNDGTLDKLLNMNVTGFG